MPQVEASKEVKEGPIDDVKSPEDITKESGALPSGFEWSVVDVKNEAQVRWGVIVLTVADARGAQPPHGQLC